MRYKRGHSRTELFFRVWPLFFSLSNSPNPCGEAVLAPTAAAATLIPPISSSSSSFCLARGGRTKEERTRLRELPLMPPTANGPPSLIPTPTVQGKKKKEKGEGGIIYLPLREKEALGVLLAHLSKAKLIVSPPSFSLFYLSPSATIKNLLLLLLFLLPFCIFPPQSSSSSGFPTRLYLWYRLAKSLASASAPSAASFLNLPLPAFSLFFNPVGEIPSCDYSGVGE